jgi:hypothetical protein
MTTTTQDRSAAGHPATPASGHSAAVRWHCEDRIARDGNTVVF